MASRQEHCKDCLNELGDEFGYVHDYLDELFVKLGPKHRSVRHHMEGIEEIRQKWGDEAGKAAEIHVRKDWYGKLPNRRQAEMWSIFGVDSDDKGTEVIEELKWFE